MKLREILAEKGSRVIVIGPQDTLREALRTLIENKVGSLLVRETPDQHVGIITERDIMRAVYNEVTLDQTRVEAVMTLTRDIVIGTPDDNTEYAMAEMTEGRFRHMPVIENDCLVGIVSIGDMVKAQLKQARSQVTELRDYVTGVPD
ncbi:MAG: CBS domain-containing protein [bacterium]|nr:CBS domain-containing protein [bacterium]